jgi:ABC-2 type transport system permease protein
MPIFDQGYQHWTGPLAGHAWRWFAITRNGVRAQLKGRLLRLLLLGAWVPALALVVVLACWGLLEQQAETVLKFMRDILPVELIAKPAEYRSAVWTVIYSFFFRAELVSALFLVTIVGPNLVSRDLRFNALPLYFSRPLRRSDYFLGKLGVIGFYLLATLAGPAVVAYLFGVGFSLSLGVIRDTHHLLWASLAYSLVITLSAGTLMLAMSSLTRRSIYVGLAWAGFVFFTWTVSTILIEIRYEDERRELTQESLKQWVQDHPPPEGVQMSGPYPIFRGGRAGRNDETNRWFREWSQANESIRLQAEVANAEQLKSDWRPLVSYPTNLIHLGDTLLGTDAAWVALGKAVERPRAALAPIAMIHGRGRLPREMTRAANDRLLADQFVWQFPWTWSAGVLGGLGLASVFVLTRRVKSLDRLK